MKSKIMKSLLVMGLAIAICAGMPGYASTSGVKTQWLGGPNAMFRITGDAPLLLLPVEDNGPESRISVLADNKTETTIHVRLAKTHTDYYVPFDLTPYKGKDVAMIVRSFDADLPERGAEQSAWWNDIKTADAFDSTNREKYRPVYHHTPEWGWMNDPNGMFYKDGEWHLYYQWNPYGSKWQNMTWGHSSSRDLVNWEHHPAAIEANGLGSVFSGSAAVDPHDKDLVWTLYTSAGDSQVQSLATSRDNGMTFEIYGGNPVLALESEARDPNMFWDAARGLWVMTLAHALDHEMLFFTSPDMKEWTLTGSFGKVAAQGGVWECPDLFQLPVAGTDKEKWMLICNINPGGPFGGSATQYFIGDFDGKTFKADMDASGQVPTKWLDYGKDHYATVTWSDAPRGRRTAIGWMSNWQYAADVPTMQFRSANTIPRELSLFQGKDGEVYAASTPSPELLALRGELFAKTSGKIGAKGKKVNLPSDGVCEILLDVKGGKNADVNFILSNAKGEKTVMTYDRKAGTFSMDRRESGITGFSADFPAVTTAPVIDDNGRLSLRVFIDRASIEAFGNDGRFAMTNIVFPTEPYTSLEITAAPGATLSSLQVFPLSNH